MEIQLTADDVEWFKLMFTALLYLVGIGVGGVTWICVLYAKNSHRFW